MKKVLAVLVLTAAFAMPANAGVLRYIGSKSPKLAKVGSVTKTIFTPPVKAGAVFAKETGKALYKVIY